jgi:hypothetical protein
MPTAILAYPAINARTPRLPNLDALDADGHESGGG